MKHLIFHGKEFKGIETIPDHEAHWYDENGSILVSEPEARHAHGTRTALGELIEKLSSTKIADEGQAYVISGIVEHSKRILAAIEEEEKEETIG